MISMEEVFADGMLYSHPVNKKVRSDVWSGFLSPMTCNLRPQSRRRFHCRKRYFSRLFPNEESET